MINTDRKEAARLFKNEDDTGSRMYSESSLRNKRIVGALAALSPLCNALFQRAEPLAGYTSLVQIPEPARSGIVTIIFAAGRLQLSYLTDTVAFLNEQFGSVHIDGIQNGQSELSNLVNATVRNALSPTGPDQSEIDAELASAVKEYFGISVSPAASRRNQHGVPSRQGSQPIGNIPASTNSSDLGVPQSPQFSPSSSQQHPGPVSQGRPSVAASAHQRRAYEEDEYDDDEEEDDEDDVHDDEDDEGLEEEDDDVEDDDEDEEDEDEEEEGSLRHGRINANRLAEQIEIRERGREPQQMHHVPGQYHQQQQQLHQQVHQQSRNVVPARSAGPAGAIDDSDDSLIRRYNDIRAAIAV